MADERFFVRGRSMTAMRILHRVLSTLYSIAAPYSVYGVENIPPGGCLMVVNHLSRFDLPLLFIALPVRPAAVFAAKEYRRNPFFRWILEFVDVIWVDRGAATASMLKGALQAIKAGDLLGIAPEGTRSQETHALQQAKEGAAFLALKARAPILPVAITNIEKAAGNLPRLRRTHVTVTFGKAFMLDAIDKAKGDRLKQATDEIMARIAALLPPEYRGVYADHRRVAELLREERTS